MRYRRESRAMGTLVAVGGTGHIRQLDGIGGREVLVRGDGFGTIGGVRIVAERSPVRGVGEPAVKVGEGHDDGTGDEKNSHGQVLSYATRLYHYLTMKVT